MSNKYRGLLCDLTIGPNVLSQKCYSTYRHGHTAVYNYCTSLYTDELTYSDAVLSLK